MRWVQAGLSMLLSGCVAGCETGAAKSASAPRAPDAAVAPAPAPDPYRDFPLYGLITGAVLLVRTGADPASPTVGWLRRGELVRLARASEKTPTCASGSYSVYPRGYACAGEGMQVSESAPQLPAEERVAPARGAPLPYSYYFVRDAKAAELQFFPSREQERAVEQYTGAWLALLRDTADAGVSAREQKKRDKRLALFEAGELPGQPKKHPVIRRFLERGFFVAGTGVVVRAERRYVRTVRGGFVKEEQLAQKSGAQFRGVELGAGSSLPLAWAVRPATPQRALSQPDGTTRLVDAKDKPQLERLALVPSWKKWANLDGQLMHELSDGTYLREWQLAVAERIARPKEVGPEEPWVHVDEGEQTLVLYVGDEPRYATLVSSGVDDHKTPLGSFRITRKFVSDTMSDIGADAADDRYSIDDVPWAQYFHGARALHAAFWHTGFGLARSHGCVNLSPADAFYLFQHTWPALPPAWHGVSAQRTGLTGSLVLITE